MLVDSSGITTPDVLVVSVTPRPIQNGVLLIADHGCLAYYRSERSLIPSDKNLKLRDTRRYPDEDVCY